MRSPDPRDGYDKPWGAHTPDWRARALLHAARNSPLGRGGARKIIASWINALHPGAIDVELWGARARLYPDNNVVELKALLRPDVYDAAERRILRGAISAPGAVFVDVGGNAGLYSLDAALHAGENATIVMIEPDPDLIGRFEFNLATARDDGLVGPSVEARAFPCAVSDREGVAYLSNVGDEGSRMLVADPGAGVAVRIATLVDIVRDAAVTKIDIMKIDVEGHEDRVLPPFLDAAPSSLWPSIIVIEHLQRSSWSPDCIAAALSRGYRIGGATNNNTILTRGASISI